MASNLSHYRHHLRTEALCHHHHHHHRGFTYWTVPPPLYPPSLTQSPGSSARLSIVPKSSHRKDPNTLPETSFQESNRVKGPDPGPPPGLSFFNPFYTLLRGFREELKFGELGLEILSIALPTALALAADPITSLVDTAFIGHLGSVELAAVGVSVSLFNLVSKLFNVPLLNITTSFVAEEQALVMKGDNEPFQVGQGRMADYQTKKLLPSVSTSLALATVVGVAEAFALSVGSGFLMNSMGILVDSPMRIPAEQFLTLRAFGAPPIVIALAAQGTFRGFKDTKTPLYAIGAGNLLNAILDPILIFLFHLGIGGAAIATVISETLGVLLTTTLATSMAAREGPIPMAGYQICLQVWLALSLLTDALALAGQAILASGYSQGNYEQARRVIYRVLQLGLAAGISLAVILFFGFGAVSSFFTSDSEVLEIARSGTLFVAGSQPMNAIAFVLDGLYYGVSDFGYAAYSMLLIGVASSVFIIFAAPVFGLDGVWAGLFLFMTLRVVAGVWRLGTKAGPWKLIWSEMDQESF